MLEFVTMKTTLAVREQAIGPLITTPDQCAKFLAHAENLAQEAFIVLTLNTKNRAVGTHLISIGTLLRHRVPQPHPLPLELEGQGRQAGAATPR